MVLCVIIIISLFINEKHLELNDRLSVSSDDANNLYYTKSNNNFENFIKAFIQLKKTIFQDNDLSNDFKKKFLMKIDKILVKINDNLGENDQSQIKNYRRLKLEVNKTLDKHIRNLKKITFIFDYLTYFNETETKLVKSTLKSMFDEHEFIHHINAIILIPSNYIKILLSNGLKIRNNIKIIDFKLNEFKMWNIFNYILNIAKSEYIFYSDRLIPFNNINSNTYIRFIEQISYMLNILENMNENSILSASVINQNNELLRLCSNTLIKYYSLNYFIQNINVNTDNQCIQCDYVNKNNIFTRRTLLISILNELNYLESNKLFMNNLYIQLKLNGYKLILCPKIVFNIATYENNLKQNASYEIISPYSNQLIELMIKYELELVNIYDEYKRLIFQFKADNCDIVKIMCEKNYLSEYYTLPRCCRQILTDFLKRFQHECDLNKVIFEIDSGTLLGAVKFQNILPWEIDADISYYSQHHEKLKIVLKNLHIKYGYSYGHEVKPINASGGSFRVYVKPYFVDMYGLSIENFQPLIKINSSSTKVKFSEAWISSPLSPGLWVRNRYGRNLFQHSLSWRFLGLKHSFEEYSNQIKYKSCPKVGHHACIAFLGHDGNYQYSDFGL